MKLVISGLFLSIIMAPLTGCCPEIQFNGILIHSHPELYSKDTYDYFIEYIKFSEGFSPRRTTCISSQVCIGYGHALTGRDTFTVVTEQVADSLLRADYQINIDYLAKNTGLRGDKLMAIAHFTYNIGMAKYLKSNLKRLVDKGLPIDKEIVKWTKIKSKSGKYVTSSHLRRMRQIELEAYN
jgi:GH24 family phage-related lysozyme (muramidase)